MWELDSKESWAWKNWCFWTVVLEKTLESPLDCKEIQPVNPQGNQFWIFSGRTEAEAEVPVPGPPDAKNWLIWKDPDAGKDWRQKEKGITKNEMVGWHHWLNGHKFWQFMVDREAWCTAVHGVAKNQTWLSNGFIYLLLVKWFKPYQLIYSFLRVKVLGSNKIHSTERPKDIRPLEQ